jgi:hypothetical protein
MSTYSITPIIRGTHAPWGIFLSAAPQNSPAEGSEKNRLNGSVYIWQNDGVVPSKKPKVRKNSKPNHGDKPFTYLNWTAMSTVVVIMTVATAKLRGEVREEQDMPASDVPISVCEGSGALECRNDDDSHDHYCQMKMRI